MFDKNYLFQCKECKTVFGTIFTDNKCPDCKSKNTKLVLTVGV